MSVQNESKRSTRDRRPTAKMMALNEQELARKEDKFGSTYDNWKVQTRRILSELKHECPVETLQNRIDTIERLESELKELYNSMRLLTTPDLTTRRRMDGCTAKTTGLVEVLRHRLTGNGEVSAAEKPKLHLLFGGDHARSTYGSTISKATALSCRSSHPSESPSISAERAETAAKRAEIAAQQCLERSGTHHARSVHGSAISKATALSCRSSHPSESSSTAAKRAEAAANRAEIAAQQCLERSVTHHARSIHGSTISRATALSCRSSHPSESSSTAAKRAEADAKLAKLAAKKVEAESLREAARLSQEQVIDLEAQCRRYSEEGISKKASRKGSYAGDPNPPPGSRRAHPAGNEATLLRAFQESIALTRLPTPEPTVFSGDPLKFIEWSTRFKALIERRCSNPADRLFYLQSYVDGEARTALEGSFYRNDGDAYRQAWQRLDDRYGHPFVMQRAFRERLNRWPKVGARESTKLREFSDFLQTCSDAMPHIKGLQVLNDCEQNQKMLIKLPEWLTSRWNRYVTDQLDQAKDYPGFGEFASFVAKEARIACNPVSSSLALKPPEERLSETRSPKANALATNTRAPNEPSTTAGPDASTKCGCCGESHSIYRCRSLTERSVEEKRRFVMDNKLCFACLRRGHISKDCRHKATCNICAKSHPTPLHEDRSPPSSSPPPRVPRTETNTASLSCCVNGGEGGSTSMIVPVWISSPTIPDSETLAYALLDTQSSHTFADQETCESLQAGMEPVKLKLSTMMGKDSIVESHRVTGLRIRGYSSATYIDLPPVYTRDFIPLERAHIPTCETANRWKHLAAIAKEMPPLMECGVGLLIGYDCSRALAPRRVITGGDYEPYAIKTDLGWSIIGNAPRPMNSGDVTGLCHRVSVRELPPLTPAVAVKILESDFADTRPGERSISQEDIQFLQILRGSIQQNEHGHLEMPLPFRVRPHLPDNKRLALVRLKNLKGKLDRNPGFKQDYTRFMESVFSDGDAERADEQPVPGNVWYIPHQGIYHHKKPDKIRVVFDASARYGGTALNDHLLTGPDLTNGLTGVLCRFRKGSIAVMCDVEKMFHRFHVNRKDRDYLRFLWWEKGDTDSEPQEYRMKVHLFGASSSPGCANYGLKHLASLNEESYPSAASFIRKHFYVDDGLISLETADEAIELVREAQAMCAEGNLHLHKFISNSREVLESICVTERSPEMKNVDLNHDDLPVQRVLGVRWDIESDTFSFKVSLGERPATRRSILSTVASIYDPLGFLSPFILSGKRVLQEMCRRGTSWDEPLPSELKPRWEGWMEDLKNLERIQIPRCFTPRNFGRVQRTELHHFSDASSQGYGQCSYIRLVNKESVHCTLIISKARVAPSKIVTIPRLELTAAMISATMSQTLREELELRVDSEYFWTDSRVVLGYINNEARKFHVFVANRVQRIREITDPKQWHYVDSAENPADHASRGLQVADLISSNWFTGPKFLWERELNVDQETSELLVGDPEVRSIQTLKTGATKHTDIEELLSRFSRWTTAVNVVARIQRLARKSEKMEPLSVQERRTAALALIRLAQREAFREELLTLGQRSEMLPCNHRLYQLDPILQDEILRVGGRLKRASAPFDLKHPIILPKDGIVTRLILTHHHGKIHHQGRGQTLNELRANGYWIVGGSKAVAQHIRLCVPCRRARRPPEEQRMSDLPSDRVDPSPPFTYCGMDCFGPFYTKQGRKEHKRYGLLLTCLCSRAVHIEMLENMTTDALINALRCFIAIRGAVRHIRSDQGSNFIGAKNELGKAIKEMSEERVATYLADKQCDFRMNAPGSSHTGGVWERQIRTVRGVLSSILQLCAGRLDDTSLRTFLYEAMSIVNNRPLAVNSISDPTSMEPLTPNHLLTMKSSVPLPPPGRFVKEDLYARKRWRQVQYLSEQFWSRWRKEYLTSITLRQQWHIPRRNMKVDDVVIVKEDEIPRNEWKVAKVLKVHGGDDGLVRRATIQIGDRNLGKRGQRLSKPPIIERPIQKLVVLVEGC